MGAQRCKRLWIGAGFLCTLIGMWWSYAPAVAANGYPYAGKPCIWAPYAVTGAMADWCPDYDWGDVRDTESAVSVISPYGYYYRNCTDYTAWKVAVAGVPETLYKGLGNAKDWATRAGVKGLRVDTVPAAGAVGVRTAGIYGHTAYVEAVDGAGILTVSQYNYRADGNYSEQSGTPAQLGLVAFVHFEDFMPALVPPSVPESLVPPEPQPEPAASEAMGDGPEPAVLAAVVFEPAAIDTEPAGAAAAEPAPAQPLQPAVPEVRTAEPAPQPVEPQPAAESIAAPPMPQPADAPVPLALPDPQVWRQAAASPPAARLASPQGTRVAARTASDRGVQFGMWPLVGLAGVLLACQAHIRRLASGQISV